MDALWLYVRALWKHWWVLMGCAAFTLLAVILANINDPATSNRWLISTSAALALLFFFVASYRAWKEQHDGWQEDNRKKLKPAITGEFFDRKIQASAPGGVYTFSVYMCEHRMRTSVKTVRVTTHSLSGEVDTADSDPYIISFGSPYGPSYGPQQPIILEPGIGVTASVSVHLKMSPNFVNKLIVAIVDAFGNEHPLESKEKLPFPFWDAEPADSTRQ